MSAGLCFVLYQDTLIISTGMTEMLLTGILNHLNKLKFGLMSDCDMTEKMLIGTLRANILLRAILNVYS